ncbi:Uncharacterised protein [Chlamydia abortus]|jgi:hypothetical protein|nr:Uncharacterised protein [Chlamydia abortus]SGA31593.1 Uncharacterised protein [Chlamydia abortus]SGA33256.1 Uncharacterised protein [Chlamydia abortus]
MKTNNQTIKEQDIKETKNKEKPKKHANEEMSF